jgi:uncharacterized integral membrane protein
VKGLRTLFGMVVFLAAVLFSMQNPDPVTLRFGLSPIKNIQWLELANVPLFLVILWAIFLGILIGGLSDLYQNLRLKKTIRQSQRIIERLEKEVHSLRATALDQPPFLARTG